MSKARRASDIIPNPPSVAHLKNLPGGRVAAARRGWTYEQAERLGPKPWHSEPGWYWRMYRGRDLLAPWGQYT